MVFTEDELQSMGYAQEKTRKVIHPILEYGNIFKLAGFNIKNGPHQIKETVEGFFINNDNIARRIKNHYKLSHESKLINGAFPVFQVEQQFIDYVLQ
jgi:hypothetical protein